MLLLFLLYLQCIVSQLSLQLCQCAHLVALGHDEGDAGEIGRRVEEPFADAEDGEEEETVEEQCQTGDDHQEPGSAGEEVQGNGRPLTPAERARVVLLLLVVRRLST